MFLTNRGSEDLKNRGFVYCLRCGRIEPKGWHDENKSYLNNRASHPKPYPNHRDRPTCAGFTQIISLGTKFISDVSLFRFHLGDDVSLMPGSTLTKVTLTTIAQALAISASDTLEIDRANVGAEYRAAQTDRGRNGAEVDVYLYDTTPGGAGFVKAAVEDPKTLLRQAIGLLDGCDCESSCYKCLRSYNNRFLHHCLPPLKNALHRSASDWPTRGRFRRGCRNTTTVLNCIALKASAMINWLPLRFELMRPT